MRVGWIVVGMVACGGGDPKDTGDDGVADPDLEGDTDTDADADADADGDADADADADGDADTDTGSTTTHDPSCPVPWTPVTPDLTDCTARWGSDGGDDGSVELRWEETYDAAGLLVTSDYDTPGGGAIDIHYEWVYDAAGLLIEARVDTRNDGTIDTLTTYVYDANGQLVSYTVASDVYSTRVDYTPGPCGAVVTDRDDDNDGTVDARTTTVWTPTDATSETDEGVNGTIELTSVSTFDAVSGTLTRTETESDAGHAGAEYAVDYAYTANETWDTITTDMWVGAQIESIVTYTYDTQDRVVERYSETTPGNNNVVRETAVWDCP